MNKAELIEAMAVRFDGNKAEASRALNAVLETITANLAEGDRVALTGFGVFEAIKRPARMVRNPATGERKKAKATTVPKFRAGTDLKAYVAGEKKVAKSPAQKATAAKAPATKASAAKTAPAKAPATKATTSAKTTATKAPAKKAATAAKTTAARTTAAKTPANKAAAGRTAAK